MATELEREWVKLFFDSTIEEMEKNGSGDIAILSVLRLKGTINMTLGGLCGIGDTFIDAINKAYEQLPDRDETNED